MPTANERALPAASSLHEGSAEGFLESVIDLLRARTGCDFSGYRRPTLERRISNRMLAVGSCGPRHYLTLPTSSEHEPQRLLERIPIKVSRFYRHRVAGFVHASDIDGSALQAARTAHYPISAMAELPSELLQRFLDPVVLKGQPSYRVTDDVRARVECSLHDITAPGSPLASGPFDLVSCRNVLIYLERPAQLAATQRLIGAMAASGVLCLGEAEWPCAELIERLEPLPHRTRLFRLRDGARR
jgi:chemotaxis methyl-accepting protein methylase